MDWIVWRRQLRAGGRSSRPSIVARPPFLSTSEMLVLFFLSPLDYKDHLGDNGIPDVNDN